MAKIELDQADETVPARRAEDAPALVAGAADILLKAVERGLDAEAIKTLVELRASEGRRLAELEFDERFAEMQAKLPAVRKTDTAKNSKGEEMYDFAPLDVMQRTCDPVIRAAGFGYNWTEEPKEDGKTVRLIISGYGHHKVIEFYCPYFDTTPRMNKAQAAAATTTFAQRYTYKIGFGITVEGEDSSVVQMSYDEIRAYSGEIARLEGCVAPEELQALWSELGKKYAGNREAIETLRKTFISREEYLKSHAAANGSLV